MNESTSLPTGNPLSDDLSAEDEGPIVVQVDEEFEGEVDADDLVAAVAATLAAEEQPGEVTVVVTTDEAVAELNQRLLGHKILGGYDLGQTYPELANTALLAVTEMNSRAQIDRLVGALQG